MSSRRNIAVGNTVQLEQTNKRDLSKSIRASSTYLTMCHNSYVPDTMAS